jgi:hypothetical protein
VLTSSAPPPSGGSIPPEQTTPPPSSSTGSASSGAGSTSSGGSPPSGSSAAAGSQAPPTIEVNRSKVKRGRKLTLSGQAAASSVALRAYIDGAWQVVAEDDSVTDGAYSVKLKATSPGVVQFQAAAAGLPESDTVSVKIKG